MDMILGCTISDGDVEKLSTWQKEQSNQVIKVIKVMADTIILKMVQNFLDEYVDPTKEIFSEDLDELEKVMHIVQMAIQIRE